MVVSQVLFIGETWAMGSMIADIKKITTTRRLSLSKTVSPLIVDHNAEALFLIISGFLMHKLLTK